MPENSPEAVMKLLAERWNAGEVEPFVALFHPDVVFLSSESWPETGRYEGRDAMRRFAAEFRGVWDDVQLEVRESFAGNGDAIAASGQWVTRGRASGVEGRLDFAIAVWVSEGLIARGQFFDELDDALRAVGAT